MDDSEMDGPVFYQKSRVSQQTAAQAREDAEEVEPYNFSNPKRGVAVIILYTQDHKGEHRLGWEHDQDLLNKTFSRLGFRVDICKDLSKADLLGQLKKVSQEDHSDCDCFVLAISSHGEEVPVNGVREDIILTTDQSIITREIVDMFTDNACPSLRGKPRVFFIQACRGQTLDEGHDIFPMKTSNTDDMLDGVLANSDRTDVIPADAMQAHTVVIDHQQHLSETIVIRSLNAGLRHVNLTKEGRQVRQEGELPKQVPITKEGRQVHQEGELPKPVVTPAPCRKDFLVMYATPPGYRAFRRPKEGSWFVKSLAEVLCKSDGTRSLTKELTQVSRLVAEKYASKSTEQRNHNKKQTPVIYSMLCKDIFMAPKKTLQDGR